MKKILIVICLILAGVLPVQGSNFSVPIPGGASLSAANLVFDGTIHIKELWAKDINGLAFKDDSGNLGLVVENNGSVRVDGAFRATSTFYTGADTILSNTSFMIEGFTNYLGLLIKPAASGTGNRFEVQDETGATEFLIKDGGDVDARSILPLIDDTYTLGDATHRFRKLYVGTGSVHIGDLVLSESGFDASVGGLEVNGELDVLGGLTAQLMTLSSSSIGKLAVHSTGGAGMFTAIGSDPADGPFLLWKEGEPFRFATATNDDGAGWSEKMRITSDGLEVTGLIEANVTGSSAALDLKSDDDVWQRFFVNDVHMASFGFDSDDDVVKLIYGFPFDTSTKGIMINSFGHLGIKVVPESPLHILSSADFGGDDLIIEKEANVATGLKIKRSETAGAFNESWYMYMDGSSTDLSFYGNGADRMTLTPDGELLLQTVVDNTIYAQLSSSLDQAAINTDPLVIIYNVQDEISGLTHSTLFSPGEITIDTAGIYFISPQPQIGKTSGATAVDFDMFLQVDRGGGFVDEPNSNIKITIKDQDITDVVVSEILIALNVGDKIRFLQRVSDAGVGLGLKATNPVVGPPSLPATPSVILAMYRVGGI